MKRMAALLAALLTVLALTAVSLAQEPFVSPEKIYVASPDGIPREVSHTKGQLTEAVEPGSTVYFVISGASRAEDLADRYARVLFTDRDGEGQEFVGDPTIEYRMLYDAAGTRQVGYSYVIALPVLEIQDGKPHRVRGRAALSRRQEGSVSFSFDIRENSGLAEAAEIECGEKTLLLEFPIGESYARLLFSDEISFTVNVSEQEALRIGFSQAEFTDVARTYPDASLHCMEWKNTPVFNRTGTLSIDAKPGLFLYEVRAHTLYDLTDTYSEEDAAFLVSTRRLGSYVVSDLALGETISPPAAENPPTGK